MITPKLRPYNAGQAKITVTLAGGDNQKVKLFIGEIISVERCSEDVFLTRIHCTSKQQYLVVESIDEITTQLEIQLMVYA